MRRPGNILLLFLLILFSACSGKKDTDERRVITVSIIPQKYFVERIAGDNFRINVMVPSGSSPETYEPAPMQMQDVANSLIYFRIGFLEFEQTVLRNIGSRNNELQIVNTAGGVDLIAAETVDHGDHVHHYGVDPHIWVSVPAVKIQLANMLEAIVNADPENEEYYLDNYSGFVDEMELLHDALKQKFSNVRRNSFLVFHPAMGYFARDYGLAQLSIEYEGKSPAAAHMKRIVDLARENGLTDVFIQMEFERENAMTVARELGGDIIAIDPLAADWLENMKEMAEKIHEVLIKE